MTAENVRGTARERSAIVAMVLVSAVLPVAAKLPPFQNVVWVFWLVSFLLIVNALILIVRINRRKRCSHDS